METQIWSPKNLIVLGLIIFAIGLIKLAILLSKKKIDTQIKARPQERHPYAKDLDELATGDTFVVIDFNDVGKPIAQLTRDFSSQIPTEKGKFFVLQDVEDFKLQKDRIYEVDRSSPDHPAKLKEVVVMF